MEGKGCYRCKRIHWKNCKCVYSFIIIVFKLFSILLPSKTLAVTSGGHSSKRNEVSAILCVFYYILSPFTLMRLRSGIKDFLKEKILTGWNNLATPSCSLHAMKSRLQQQPWWQGSHHEDWWGGIKWFPTLLFILQEKSVRKRKLSIWEK